MFHTSPFKTLKPYTFLTNMLLSFMYKTMVIDIKGNKDVIFCKKVQLFNYSKYQQLQFSVTKFHKCFVSSVMYF